MTTRADTGAATPLAGVVISITGTSLGAISGREGRFAIDRVPAGAHTVRMQSPGFRVAQRALRLRAGDTARVDVTLLAEVQVLSAMRADAQLAAVEMFRTKPNISTVTMGAAAMAGVPSLGEPDLVRVVQLMPGVSRETTTTPASRCAVASRTRISSCWMVIRSTIHSTSEACSARSWTQRWVVSSC